MKLKNILLCAMALMVLAPVAAFARGPHFSISLNMIAPPRPCIVRPCPPPPPPPVIYYSPYYVYPCQPWAQGFNHGYLPYYGR